MLQAYGDGSDSEKTLIPEIEEMVKSVTVTAYGGKHLQIVYFPLPETIADKDHKRRYRHCKCTSLRRYVQRLLSNQYKTHGVVRAFILMMAMHPVVLYRSRLKPNWTQ